MLRQHFSLPPRQREFNSPVPHTMKEYEYNIIVREQGDLWYYTIAQEIDGEPDILCWGYTETRAEAIKAVGVQLRGTFAGYNA